MKQLFKGCHAIAEAAIRAGCRGYFGYPITPQSEIGEYMSEGMPKVNGVFIQAESELAAGSMVFGAAAAGIRAMTSSSGVGIALMQETISAMVATQLPTVLVNITRGGPGGGSIQPAQSDYFQSTRGGGNGDYNLLVITPNSVQELVDYTYEAFELADKYRSPVLVMADGVLAQMMEEAEMPEPVKEIPKKEWAADGKRYDGANRGKNTVTHVFVPNEKVELLNDNLQKKFAEIAANEVRWEEKNTEDADIILVAYGVSSRICEDVMDIARAEGIKVGLFRPITVWPFPSERLVELSNKTKKFLCVEMSCGQMVQDVKAFLGGTDAKAYHYGRKGGIVHTVSEVMAALKDVVGKEGV